MDIKTHKCRYAECNYEVEAKTAVALTPHYREVHGLVNRTPRKRGGTAPLVIADAECDLLQRCVEVFNEYEDRVDNWGQFRVLEHLTARFGRSAYDSEEGKV